MPAVVSHGIEHLVGYFPVYEQYHKCLSIPTGEGLPLRTPLINIHVEYLTFCILAQRLAKSSFGKLDLRWAPCELGLDWDWETGVAATSEGGGAIWPTYYQQDIRCTAYGVHPD